MSNVLGDALGVARSLLQSEMFEAAVVGLSMNKVVIRRPNSTQTEGPYRTLGAPPPIGSIVSVIRIGTSYIVLTHHGHQAFGGPTFVAADYTTKASDTFIVASPSSGDIRIILTVSHPAGAELTIKRARDGTANSVFIEALGGLIENLAEIELAVEGNSVILRKETTNWWIVGGF